MFAKLFDSPGKRWLLLDFPSVIVLLGLALGGWGLIQVAHASPADDWFILGEIAVVAGGFLKVRQRALSLPKNPWPPRRLRRGQFSLLSLLIVMAVVAVLSRSGFPIVYQIVHDWLYPPSPFIYGMGESPGIPVRPPSRVWP